ncbi:MAG: thioredoxin family protein [Methylacidiphilaceae bacterium]|nr:thioredoxin family protein [Candidatus Methylacidiphilaceae bacterium]
MDFARAARRLQSGRLALVLGWMLPLLFSAVAFAGSANWITDYPKALKEAKAQKKLVLANFTGSDWCPWCQKLQREVFSTPEFQQYAKEHLVLLELDFPQRKPQTEALKQQNKELADRYHVDAFPTILLLDPEGQEVASMGYLPGGAKPFLDKVEQFRQKATSGG